MTRTEWLTATGPGSMLGFLRSRASDRKLRLFVVACCRRVWDGLQDVRSRTAVEVAERFADGNATEAELVAAHDEAYVAVDDCVGRSAFSEDLANAACLAAATTVNERREHSNDDSGDVALHAVNYAIDGLIAEAGAAQVLILRDVFGDPFRPVAVDPDWLTPTVVALARTLYESRDFAPMPVLADALEDTGCEDEQMLGHCRGPGPHVRGCWVVDLVLGRS